MIKIRIGFNDARRKLLEARFSYELKQKEPDWDLMENIAWKIEKIWLMRVVDIKEIKNKRGINYDSDNV